MDGSSTNEGGGAGLILISPHGTPLKYAVSLHFATSNNQAEYEALVSGLRLALEMEVCHLIAYSDSQLIVNQVKGDFEAKEERMQEYLSLVRALLTKFANFEIHHVPREENAMADALAKFASANILMGPALTGHQFEPSTFKQEESKVHCASTESNWMTSIQVYLEEGTLPDDPAEAKK